MLYLLERLSPNELKKILFEEINYKNLNLSCIDLFVYFISVFWKNFQVLISV